MRTMLILAAALFISNMGWADDLADQFNGTAHDNGDGTYSIVVQTEDGNIFSGKGINQGDGTLAVTVKDTNGVTYQGLASNNDDEEYILTLNNVVTGTVASGVLEEE